MRGLWQPKNKSGKRLPYYVRVVMPDGTRRIVSTRQRELQPARVAARRLQVEAARGEPLSRRRFRLEDVMSAFLLAREVTGGRSGAGCAAATLEMYREKRAALEGV